MKPTEVLLLSGLLLALCLTSLFALWRRANRIQSEVAGAPRVRWTYTPGSSPASGNLIWQSVNTQHKFLTPPALEDDDALYVADDYTDLFAFAPRLGPNLNWKQMSYSPTGS